jgi:peroxiredoxin
MFRIFWRTGGGKRTMIPVGLVLMTVIALLFGGMTARAEMDFGDEKFKVGDKAADFTAPDLDGKKFTLSAFQGEKVVLLNFWGLRCGACIEEIPYLNALNDKYGDNGLVILGVGTDGVGADIVRSTMKEVGITADYTILLDLEFTITDTYTNFLVPLTLVIDKGGVVQFVHTGYEGGDELKYEAAVKKALGL